MNIFNNELAVLGGGLFTLLVLASVIAQLLSLRVRNPQGQKMMKMLKARIRAWWVMCFIFGIAVFTKGVGTCILFFFISYLALREYVTCAPTRRADHRPLFWMFFVFLPIQYYLLLIQWYGFFSIFIPVYCFVFLAARSVLSGEAEGFLTSNAILYWGLMICVYCISHVPALMFLDIPMMHGKVWKCLFYLVFITQMNDVLQYIAGNLFGKRKIAPKISPNKTIEGFYGGLFGSMLLGAVMSWLTPFGVWVSMLVAAVISCLGLLGDLTLSAVKRDRHIKDFGSMIEGHGGILDRIDSLALSAPIFFHFLRYFYSV